MGYHQRAFKARCGNCDKVVAWLYKPPQKAPNAWTCKCNHINYLKPLPEWPEIPRSLYIGHQRNSRFKVYPVPRDAAAEDWAQPYSIRSFVSQASQKYGGCNYRCHSSGTVMGEPVFDDYCNDGSEWIYAEAEKCHFVNGWTAGKPTCPLWDSVAHLCQTDSERRFLHQFLSYVKDRQFPILLPQTWIGIADRRRPDFVAFVPLQYWKYRWIAIQLDGAHTEANAEDDFERDQFVQQHNYEVISLRPNEKGYLEEARSLVEQIEEWMTIVDDDPWKVAIEIAIAKTVENHEIPF